MSWINRTPLKSRNIWLTGPQGRGHFRLAKTLTFALGGQLTEQPPGLQLGLDHLGEIRIHRRSPRDERVQVVSLRHSKAILPYPKRYGRTSTSAVRAATWVHSSPSTHAARLPVRKSLLSKRDIVPLRLLPLLLMASRARRI